MKRSLIVLCVLFALSSLLVAQPAMEKVDTAMVSKIKDEGTNRSKIMETLSFLSDVYGPRLTWSPEYRRAADWASGYMKQLGLVNVRYDNWGPVGKGWTLKHFAAEFVSPQSTPLLAYPKAWSPGTKGMVKGNVVYLKATTSEELAAYKGKLKGAFVFMSDPREIKAHFEPLGNRLSDSSLLAMSNASSPAGMMGRMMRDSSALQRFVKTANFNAEKFDFCKNEGAAVLVDMSRGDGGTIFVQGASVPRKVESINDMFSSRTSPSSPDAPEILPQVTMAGEHYNRILRMLDRGEKVQIAMNIEVAWAKPDSGFNVIAEIPGTDLKDEVVMIGGHFDSWHAGTGATDNGTGSAVCLEAMRILKAVGAHPRRTIRIGLWGGEEEGLYGSREYVGEVLGHRGSNDMMGMMMGRNSGPLEKTAAYDKFDVYFNNDNGSGRVRGVYMQGNEAVRPILRDVLTAVKDPTAQTLTIENTSGTDHLSFDAIGLPGFQFIQDPLEYDTRTHHSNMDVYDRVQQEDVKQGAIMMAIFAYDAAMRTAMYPRKPMPAPPARPVGSN